jgi:hypothetical protein
LVFLLFMTRLLLGSEQTLCGLYLPEIRRGPDVAYLMWCWWLLQKEQGCGHGEENFHLPDVSLELGVLTTSSKSQYCGGQDEEVPTCWAQ